METNITKNIKDMEKTFENPQQIGTQDNKSDKNKATSAYTQQQLEANTQIKGFLPYISLRPSLVLPIAYTSLESL